MDRLTAALPTQDQRQAVSCAKERYIPENQTERITRNADAYLMPDADFERFCKLRHARRELLGLRLEPHPRIEPWDLSADAYSRDELRKAEDALIEAGTCFLPEKMQTAFRSPMGYDHRQKLIGIIMEWNTNR